MTLGLGFLNKGTGPVYLIIYYMDFNQIQNLGRTAKPPAKKLKYFRDIFELDFGSIMVTDYLSVMWPSAMNSWIEVLLRSHIFVYYCSNVLYKLVTHYRCDDDLMCLLALNSWAEVSILLLISIVEYYYLDYSQFQTQILVEQKKIPLNSKYFRHVLELDFLDISW